MSIVAVVFHLRGHHYIDGDESAKLRNDNKFYNDLLRTVFDEVKAKKLIELLTIKGIARYATHAIPPYVLHKTCYDNWTHLHGAIKLRLSSYPAGCALIGSVESGIKDILSAFPDMTPKYQDTLDYLNQYKTKLLMHVQFNPANWRSLMKGSVNARLYG